VIDPLSIRPAWTDDVEVLTTIRREAILTLATGKMGRSDARGWANSAGPNRVRRAIEVHQVWVAEIAAQPVGWVEFNGNRIEGLYVRPARAQQGVGSRLLAHAEAQIWSAGYRTVMLDASWNAEQFYINRDYQPLSERSPERGRPMVKPLAPGTVETTWYTEA